jgi:prepilin-type N-terminal cleavage/methylation domain-containing protein
MKGMQSGFSLVEIAIVLLIIGLLMGGALKGQEMISQARIRNIVNDLTGIATALYAYQDRYRKLPGDDERAEGRWTAAATKQGDGNGVVGDSGNATAVDCALAANAGSENCRFWQHLRLAGLLTGDAASLLPPTHAAGGHIHVQSGALGIAGLVVCADGLSGKLADAVDAQIDDGKPGSGQVRATTDASKLATATDPTAAYVDDGATTYVLCRST